MTKNKYLVIPIIIIIMFIVVLITLGGAPTETNIKYKPVVHVLEQNEAYSHLPFMQWKLGFLASNSTSVIEFRGAEVVQSTTYIGDKKFAELEQEAQYQREFEKETQTTDGGWFTLFYAVDFREIEYKIINTEEKTLLEIYKFNNKIATHELENVSIEARLYLYSTKGDNNKILFRLGGNVYLAGGNGNLTLLDCDYKDLSINEQIIIVGNTIYSVGLKYYNDPITKVQSQYYLLVSYNKGKLADRVALTIQPIIPGEGIGYLIIKDEV